MVDHTDTQREIDGESMEDKVMRLIPDPDTSGAGAEPDNDSPNWAQDKRKALQERGFQRINDPRPADLGKMLDELRMLVEVHPDKRVPYVQGYHGQRVIRESVASIERWAAERTEEIERLRDREAQSDHTGCHTLPNGECVSESRCMHTPAPTMGTIEAAIVALVPPRDRSKKMREMDALVALVELALTTRDDENDAWITRAADDKIKIFNLRSELSTLRELQLTPEEAARSATGLEIYANMLEEWPRGKAYTLYRQLAAKLRLQPKEGG